MKTLAELRANPSEALELLGQVPSSFPYLIRSVDDLLELAKVSGFAALIGKDLSEPVSRFRHLINNSSDLTRFIESVSDVVRNNLFKPNVDDSPLSALIDKASDLVRIIQAYPYFAIVLKGANASRLCALIDSPLCLVKIITANMGAIEILLSENLEGSRLRGLISKFSDLVEIMRQGRGNNVLKLLKQSGRDGDASRLRGLISEFSELLLVLRVVRLAEKKAVAACLFEGEGNFCHLVKSFDQLYNIILEMPEAALALVRVVKQYCLINNFFKLSMILKKAPQVAVALFQEQGHLSGLVENEVQLMMIIRDLSPEVAVALFQGPDFLRLSGLISCCNSLYHIIRVLPEVAVTLFRGLDGERLSGLISNFDSLSSVVSSSEEVAVVLFQGLGGKRLSELIPDFSRLHSIMVQAPKAAADLLQGPGGTRLRGLMTKSLSLFDAIAAAPCAAVALLGSDGDPRLRGFITRGSDLAWVIERAPDVAADLLQGPGGKRLRALIDTDQPLVRIIKAAPQVAADLLRRPDGEHLSRLIVRSSDLLSIIEAAPQVAVALLQGPGGEHLSRLIVRSSDLLSIIEAAPQVAVALLQGPGGLRLRNIRIQEADLASLIYRSPQVAANLLQGINGPHLLALIKNTNILVPIIEAASYVAVDLFQGPDGERLRALIDTDQPLVRIIEAAPQVAADLLRPKKEGGCRHLITSFRALAQVLNVVPLNQLEQLLGVSDPLIGFLNFQQLVNDCISGEAFQFSQLSKFIDGHSKRSSSVNLLIATILMSREEVFSDSTHPAYDGIASEIDYLVNRLIDAMRYAYQALAGDSKKENPLVLACLVIIKLDLNNILTDYATHLDQFVVKRIDLALRKLENTTFDFQNPDGSRASPLPPVSLFFLDQRFLARTALLPEREGQIQNAASHRN